MQDTTWESDKNAIKHNIQESQEARPFPAGDHKAAMNIQISMTNTKHKHQKWSTKKHGLGTVSNFFLLESLNKFHCTSLALRSDVDQDT